MKWNRGELRAVTDRATAAVREITAPPANPDFNTLADEIRRAQNTVVHNEAELARSRQHLEEMRRLFRDAVKALGINLAQGE